MQSASFPAQQARTHYRHELRTLTYVTLDEANGGIIRNINDEGVAVQAVAALRLHQRVRLRFELRFPRLRVDASGQVSWTSPSGQCGIRFVDMPAGTRHQIDEWMFSNLLDALARYATHPRSIFGASVVSIVREENVPLEDDGLTLSAAPQPPIRLEPSSIQRDEALSAYPNENISDPNISDPSTLDPAHDPFAQLNWLSRPLSGRALAWLVDSLAVTAALLLFALVFLSIAHELPPWPLALGTGAAAAVFVAATYKTLFAVFGGRSLGARLAHEASTLEEKDESEHAVRIR